jgi:hypothetical protein
LVCLRYFYSSRCNIQKCSKHTNQRTFLNITTTGVKIPQAHQSKDISEYHKWYSEMSFDWCAWWIFIPVVVIFRNVHWLVCLLYFFSSRCDIQKCSLIGVLAVFLLQSLWYSEMFAHQSKDISEYHNYWSKNTASTPINEHFWISQLLE